MEMLSVGSVNMIPCEAFECYNSNHSALTTFSRRLFHNLIDFTFRNFFFLELNASYLNSTPRLYRNLYRFLCMISLHTYSYHSDHQQRFSFPKPTSWSFICSLKLCLFLLPPLAHPLRNRSISQQHCGMEASSEGDWCLYSKGKAEDQHGTNSCLIHRERSIYFPSSMFYSLEIGIPNCVFYRF